MRLLGFAAVLALAACATGDIADGRDPQIDARRVGYWLWHDAAGQWHLRMTGGKHPHRFQGSLTGLSGSIVELKLSDPLLEEHAASKGDTVEFDVETSDELGLDVRVAGGCLSFDLYLDGRRRPERVRLGRSHQSPPRVPFERCL